MSDRERTKGDCTEEDCTEDERAEGHCTEEDCTEQIHVKLTEETPFQESAEVSHFIVETAMWCLWTGATSAERNNLIKTIVGNNEKIYNHITKRLDKEIEVLSFRDLSIN